MLSGRERRTIAAGLAVSAFALFTAFGVIPFARRWQTREAAIAAESEQLARLRGLLAHQDDLRGMVAAGSSALEDGQQRLLAGRTPALVASALQTLLQNYADQSQVTVSRLDVAGEALTTKGVSMMPATVSAIGDVYGITQMLYLIKQGSRLLVVSELTVRPNPALRGDLLQMTVTLRAPYVSEVTP